MFWFCLLLGCTVGIALWLFCSYFLLLSTLCEIVQSVSTHSFCCVMNCPLLCLSTPAVDVRHVGTWGQHEWSCSDIHDPVPCCTCTHAPLNPSTSWGETAGSWRKRVFSFSMMQRPCIQARSSSGSSSHHWEGFPVQLSPYLGNDHGLLALDEGLSLYPAWEAQSAPSCGPASPDHSRRRCWAGGSRSSCSMQTGQQTPVKVLTSLALEHR